MSLCHCDSLVEENSEQVLKSSSDQETIRHPELVSGSNHHGIGSGLLRRNDILVGTRNNNQKLKSLDHFDHSRREDHLITSTHPAHLTNHSSLIKQAAFTLAEVLITLGIIGVVAAMTLPTLIQNHRKQQTLTGLKKAYTIISQAIKLSEIDNGEYANWTIPEGENPPLAYIQKYFLPYFKGSTVCDTPEKCGYNSNTPFKHLNGSQATTVFADPTLRTPFLTSDGILYSVSVMSGGNASNVLFVDINGPKAPNTYGIDVFEFLRTNKGVIPNYGERDEAPICTKELSWHCAKNIIEAGWEIPDDYPYKF